MKPCPRHFRRRGFAMLVAIAMLGLAAAVLVVLARHFAYEVARTRIVTNDAQLSQLLHAAAADAVIRSKDWPADAKSQDWDLQPPEILASQSPRISVALKAVGDQKAEVQIDAQLDSQRAATTLRFTHTDAGWTFASVEQPNPVE